MGWQEPETARQGDPVAGRAHGKLRAADADRDRAAGMLGAAYSEGRLSRDEHDARLDAALSARTYADLDQVLTDLPAEPATPASPARTSGQAVSARTSGQAVSARPSGLAVAGLALGWAVVILGIALVLMSLLLTGGMHGPMRMN